MCYTCEKSCKFAKSWIEKFFFTQWWTLDRYLEILSSLYSSKDHDIRRIFDWVHKQFVHTYEITYAVGPCLVRFRVVQIWIVRVLKNTPDLHSAYYGFLAFSDHLYYSGTCVVRFLHSVVLHSAHLFLDK